MSAIGPQFHEFIKKLDENNGKLPTSVTSRTFQPEFEFNVSIAYFDIVESFHNYLTLSSIFHYLSI